MFLVYYFQYTIKTEDKLSTPDKKLSFGIFGVTRNKGGEYLMVRHNYGLKKWGGGFEQGEFFSDACVRETLEETSLAVTVTRLIGQFTLVKTRGGLILYETKIVGGEINPSDPEEISDCCFFSKEEITKLWEKELVYDAQYSLILWSEMPPKTGGLPHEGWLTVPPTPK